MVEDITCFQDLCSNPMAWSKTIKKDVKKHLTATNCDYLFKYTI